MGLFDAATPDQKKKRNQRKDASVLHQMMISSQAITTTELVANLDLEIERTRDVYDAPSIEGTPVRFCLSFCPVKLYCKLLGSNIRNSQQRSQGVARSAAVSSRMTTIMAPRSL